jgi:hypothetical protein
MLSPVAAESGEHEAWRPNDAAPGVVRPRALRIPRSRQPRGSYVVDNVRYCTGRGAVQA